MDYLIAKVIMQFGLWLVDWLSSTLNAFPLYNWPSQANLFVKHVFRLQRLPESITSDWGPKFVNRFWKQLCACLRISFKLYVLPITQRQMARSNGRKWSLSSICICMFHIIKTIDGDFPFSWVLRKWFNLGRHSHKLFLS